MAHREPALLGGSYPSAYRPVDSRYNYASSSAYSPPGLHHNTSSRPAYAVHSRTNNNASTDRHSQLGHDGTFSDPSNHSPGLQLDLPEPPIQPFTFNLCPPTCRCRQTFDSGAGQRPTSFLALESEQDLCRQSGLPRWLAQFITG